jgi:Bacterial TSP3 repeat
MHMRGRLLFAYSLVVALAACGGGGGGGSGGGTPSAGAGGGGGSTPPPPAQVPLVFSGVSTAASVSATNAGALAADVMSVMGVAAGNSFGMQLTGKGGLTGAAIDSKACDSGTMQVSGNVASNGTGTLSISYNACRNAAHTLNGPATLQINSYDATNKIITDGTVTMTRINVSGPGMNADITGAVQKQINVSTNTETLTANITAQDNTSGRMMKTENLVIVNGHADVLNPTFYKESITGTVVDSVAGSVTVSSTTPQYVAPWGPLYFATSKQPFPDWGVIVLTGATTSTGAKPNITVSGLSSALAKVQVDTNGDGTFEHTARVSWMDFGSPIAADLADNDGDGMHNSWESANNLNPNDPSDANGDFDGDGYTNMAEYLAGSDPASIGSVPSALRQTFFTGTTDIAAAGNIIYASVGSANIVVPFDTITGEPSVTPIPVGSNPRKLASSDDGSFLYVGVDGSTVQRINLTTRAMDLSLALPSGTSVDDMHALPGAPASLAVSLQFPNSSPRFAGVAIYDAATPRANAFSGSAGPNVLACSASTIYGYQSEGDPFAFYRMTVDATGITAAEPFAGLITGAGGISFAGGLIYTAAGQQIDPGTPGVTPPTVLGTFDAVVAANALNAGTTLVLTDAGSDRVFYFTPSATAGV